ncbi:MAG: cytochrome P460 family protein [Deltaproteobacteria bacterium]
MKRRSRWSHHVLIVAVGAALVAGVVIATTAPLSASGTEGKIAKFDKNGALIRPEGYREWIYVGTPITPNDMNGGKAAFPEFHDVYIDPVSYAHYKKTGKFRDGTVLIKELVSVGSKKAPSGKGYFMGKFIGLAVSLKDSKRYPKEPGHWAYFLYGQSYPLKKKVKAMPTASCNACHEGAAAQDWVFTQYYPVLRAAKPK